METLFEGENLEQQGESSMQRRGKRKMEDKPETLGGRRSWKLKAEENHLLEIKFWKCRETLAEILRCLKGEKDLIASSKDMEMEHSLEGVKQEQHEASEIDEAGNKLKKACGRSSRKRTEKVKDIVNFISDLEPTKEEFSVLLNILSNRTRLAYKKAEKEEYKIRVEHINGMREVVAYMAEENKRLRNELKEMEAKMNEMVALKMLLHMEVEKLQQETLHEMLLNQLEGKPTEHNFDGLPYTDGGLLPNFTNPQMRELRANETPNTVVVVEASTSSTARNNEENMRLEKQVYELKEYVQALENQIYGHTPCHY